MTLICVGDRLFLRRIEDATAKNIFHHSNYYLYDFDILGTIKLMLNPKANRRPLRMIA